MQAAAADSPYCLRSLMNAATVFFPRTFSNMNALVLTVLVVSGFHGDHPGHRAHCWGPMPQTCYDPAYGCYPGTRSMHRYPAFHGTYYRRPYNYRQAFEYPWHADLHEPTSHFSYQVTGETGGQRPLPIPEPPVPAAAAPLPLHERIERATIASPGSRIQRGISTLRR